LRWQHADRGRRDGDELQLEQRQLGHDDLLQQRGCHREQRHQHHHPGQQQRLGHFDPLQRLEQLVVEQLLVLQLIQLLEQLVQLELIEQLLQQ
jgi:hypothetical protein